MKEIKKKHFRAGGGDRLCWREERTVQGMKTHLNNLDQVNYDYLEMATVIVREMPRGQPFWATKTTPSWACGSSLNT